MKKLATLLTLALVTSSPPAYSGAVGEDFPQLGARILRNLTTIIINEERLNQVDRALEIGAELRKLDIEAFNNAWANVISRAGDIQTELQNAKVKIKSQPALNVCGAYTAAIYEEISLCEALDEVLDYKREHYGAPNVFGKRSDKESRESNGPSSNPEYSYSGSISEKEKQIIEQMTVNRPDLIKSTGKEEQAELASPALASTDGFMLLTGQEQFSTISEEDADVMSNFIYLIAPPFEKDNLKYVNQEISDIERVDLLRDSANHSAPAQSLFYVLEKRLPSGNSRGSYINTLERYAGNVFGPEEDTVSTAMMTSPLATPSAIYRNMVVLKASKAKSSLEEFKQNLRDEANLAFYLMSVLQK